MIDAVLVLHFFDWRASNRTDQKKKEERNTTIFEQMKICVPDATNERTQSGFFMTPPEVVKRRKHTRARDSKWLLSCLRKQMMVSPFN